MAAVRSVLIGLIDLYQLLVIGYVLLSWVRPAGRGVVAEAYRVLGTVVEPWLGLFRRFIPPIGMVDVSPVVALLALYAIQRVVGAVLR